MKPKILVEHTGWKAPSWMTNMDPGRMMPVYSAMGKDNDRNTKIIGFVKQAYAAGRTVVLMSDIISHLKALSNLAINSGIDPEDIGFYTGEVTKALLKPNANKRVVLATYGMCGEGTDYPQWDTLVMVTPRANIKQPLGRILRTKPGKKQPVCLDLIDSGSIFKGFYYRRLKQYHEVGGEVVTIT